MKRKMTVDELIRLHHRQRQYGGVEFAADYLFMYVLPEELDLRALEFYQNVTEERSDQR